MAATAITPTAPTQAGIAPAAEVAADAVNGNSVPNSKGLHMIIRSADAGPQNVVFTTPGSVGGFAVAEHTVSIPAGATRHFADFDRAAFGDTLVFTAATATLMVTAYVI